MRLLGRGIYYLALTMAVLGGLALVAIMLITILSISGRALLWAGLGPIPGDFELVEAGTAFAVFAFLPWCHLRREHATVEILTQYFGVVANRVIDVVVDLLMLVIAAVLAYQHWLGTLDKLAYGETSFILRFPLWWAYAAGLVGAVVFVVVAVYCLAGSIGILFGAGRRESEGPVA